MSQSECYGMQMSSLAERELGQLAEEIGATEIPRLYELAFKAELSRSIQGQYALIQSYMVEPFYLARIMARHSQSEQIGADTLAYAASFTNHSGLRSRMIAHAADEARHAAIFAALGRKIDKTAGYDGSSLKAENDLFISQFDGDTFGLLMDTHIAELRNLRVLDIYLSLLPSWNSTHRDVVEAAIASIRADEKRHLTYTAVIIERALGTDARAWHRLSASMAGYERASLGHVSDEFSALAKSSALA